MARNTINAAPKVVAAGIQKIVERNVPDRARLRSLSRQLLRRHSLFRLEPVVSSEEVVEAYFRCVVTHGLAGRYDLTEADIPNCINSSHRAVRRVCATQGHTHATIEDHAWRQGWSAMRQNNRQVDIVVGGSSPKRADLYVVAADEVVSVEFKYVGLIGLRDVGACAAQLGLHAAHHAEAISVLYSGTPVPRQVLRVLAQQSGAAHVRVINIIGPEIPVARGTA